MLKKISQKGMKSINYWTILANQADFTNKYYLIGCYLRAFEQRLKHKFDLSIK